MCCKLFGETIYEQERYLRIRVIVSIIALISLVISLFSSSDFGLGVVAIALLMWGWSAMRAFFGITSMLSFFALRFNPVLIAVILVIYLILGYLAGFIIMPIGIFRYIILMYTRKKGWR